MIYDDYEWSRNHLREDYQSWHWHKQTLEQVKQGKIKITVELMHRIRPGWKRDFIEAIIMRKVK